MTEYKKVLGAQYLSLQTRLMGVPPELIYLTVKAFNKNSPIQTQSPLYHSYKVRQRGNVLLRK